MNKSQFSIRLLYSHMESMTKTQQHFQEMQRNTAWTKDFTSGQPVLLEEENGNSLQDSCLENSMDREAWWATVQRVAKSQTRLSTCTSCPSITSYNLISISMVISNYNWIIISMMISSITFLNLVNFFYISLFLCLLDMYWFSAYQLHLNKAVKISYVNIL